MDTIILNFLQAPGLSTAAVILLFNITLKSLFILCFVFLCTRMMRRASSAIRHLIWTTALAGILLLPILGAVLPTWNISVLPYSISQVPEARLEKAQDDSLQQPSSEFVLNGELDEKKGTSFDNRTTEKLFRDQPGDSRTMLASVQKNPEGSVRSGIFKNGAAFLAAAWLLGMAVFLVRIIAGKIVINKLAGKSRIITEPSWLQLSDELKCRFQIKRPIRLLESRRIEMPMTWGLKRPSIMLPAKADRWSGEERRYVLMHEFAHIKRLDSLTQLLSQISVAVQWFNPFMWISYRQLLNERERACDDFVLKDCPHASEYAGMLLNVARSLSSVRLVSQATVAMARKKQLEGRLLAILSPDKKRRVLSRFSVLLVSVVVLSMVLPVAALRPLPSAKIAADTMEVVGSDIDTSWAGKSTSPDMSEQTSLEKEKNSLVVKSLAETLTDPDLEVRKTAAQTLGKIRNKEAVPALISALKDSNWEMRAVSADALGNIRDKAAAAALIALVRDEDWHVRLEAIEALGNIRDEKAIGPLGEALKDMNRSIRMAAVEALGYMEDRRAANPLSEALNDEDWRIRCEAAQALGDLEDKSAVDPLISVLKDSNWEVRMSAVEALGDIADPRSIGPLIESLKDDAWQARKEAAWALGEIEDPKAVSALLRALNDPHPEVKKEVISALDDIGDAEAVLPLCEALNDEDWEVRMMAAEALGELGDPRAVEPLTDRLKDENKKVRQAAAKALGEIRWRS